MRFYWWQLASTVLALVGVLATADLAVAQEDRQRGPVHNAGDTVTGAFEGWFPNQDGTFSIMLGYFNRNFKEVVDIPVGPDNQIQPGGPDRGQPTHFLPGRQWGVFTINVPKDFGTKTLTWTLTVNGQSTSIVLSLNPLYVLAPFSNADYDTPAYVSFAENGPYVNGPVGISESLTAVVGVPVPLNVWVADDAVDSPTPDAPPAGIADRGNGKRVRQTVTVNWMLFRGPSSAVRIDKTQPDLEKLGKLSSPPPGTKFFGRANTTVTFSQPGEYVLGAQALDSSSQGSGSDQCCWSNVKVSVSVKAAASAQ